MSVASSNSRINPIIWRWAITPPAPTPKQFNDDQLQQIVRGHWAAIENGSHLRRDVTYREDECQVSGRGAAQVLATLRNLALGLYELEQERGRTKTKQFKSWCRRMTASAALKLVARG